MTSKIIALVGGAGFIGTNLSNRLKKNNISHEIFDLKTSFNSNNDIIPINVEDPNSLDKLKHADTIVNLAAVHTDNVFPISRYDDVNVGGAINICDSARKHNIKKIIFTSSVAIYGFAAPNTDETGSPNYFNDYGRTKFLAENVYKKWHSEDPKNRKLVILRPTVIFGKGNRGNIYNLFKKIASKQFIMFGDGKNRKSIAYVENFVSFIEFCLSFQEGLHVYNYVDKPDYDMNTLVKEVRKILFKKNNIGLRFPAFLGLSIGYLADIINRVFGAKLTISSVRVKKFMSTTQFSTSISKINFIPPKSLKEALYSTIKYEFLEDNKEKKEFITE